MKVDSAPSVTAAFRKHGIYCYFGAPDARGHRAALLSRAQGRAVVLKGVDCQSRFVAALFEFKGAQGPRKILVAATYGHASDPTSATEHAIQMTIEPPDPVTSGSLWATSMWMLRTPNREPEKETLKHKR